MTKRTSPGVPLAFLLSHVNDPHSVNDPCVVWPYWRTTLGYGGVVAGGRRRLAHVVLLELRDGPAPEDTPHALHGPCHDQLCIIHTRWGTQAENMADRLRDGTDQRGERNPNARLSASDAAAIRERYVKGNRWHGRGNCAALAAEFGVAESMISRIAAGRRWSHI